MLASLIMEWDESMIVAEQWLAHLMAMIPTKKGLRTVATMASGYRIYSGLDAGAERQWKVDNSHADDSSKPHA